MTSERPDGPRDEDEPPLADHLRNRPDRPDAPMKVRSQTRLLLLLMFAAIPLLALLAVVLSSLASGPPSTRPDGGGGTSSGLAQVTRYCNYVVQAEVEFEGCLEENRDRAFLDEDSNPARYARGELTECLDDAGPRCAARQTVRQ